MIVDKYGRKWYKCNFHMHTNLSDGNLSPEEAVNLYKENGYDVLAITDHWTYYYDDVINGVTILAGDEYSCGKKAGVDLWHIVGLGCETKPQVKSATNPDAREIVDAIHEGKGLAILAHPAWSLNGVDKILEICDFDGAEIYNSISGEPINCSARAYSGVILDTVAARGKDYFLYACDDVHFYDYYDKCRSFVYVNAESNSKKDIMDALRKGSFYASQGPILDVKYNNGLLHIECSPCEFISVCTDSEFSRKRNITGENLTEFTYEPVPRDHVLRVEVRDKNKNWAWSQYIRID